MNTDELEKQIKNTMKATLEKEIAEPKNNRIPSFIWDEDYAGGSEKYISEDVINYAREEAAKALASFIEEREKEKDEQIEKLEVLYDACKDANSQLQSQMEEEIKTVRNSEEAKYMNKFREEYEEWEKEKKEEKEQYGKECFEACRERNLVEDSGVKDLFHIAGYKYPTYESYKSASTKRSTEKC